MHSFKRLMKCFTFGFHGATAMAYSNREGAIPQQLSFIWIFVSYKTRPCLRRVEMVRPQGKYPVVLTIKESRPRSRSGRTKMEAIAKQANNWLSPNARFHKARFDLPQTSLFTYFSILHLPLIPSILSFCTPSRISN
jgi:hypothetical protein